MTTRTVTLSLDDAWWLVCVVDAIGPHMTDEDRQITRSMLRRVRRAMDEAESQEEEGK